MVQLRAILDGQQVALDEVGAGELDGRGAAHGGPEEPQVEADHGGVHREHAAADVAHDLLREPPAEVHLAEDGVAARPHAPEQHPLREDAEEREDDAGDEGHDGQGQVPAEGPRGRQVQAAVEAGGQGRPRRGAQRVEGEEEAEVRHRTPEGGQEHQRQELQEQDVRSRGGKGRGGGVLGVEGGLRVPQLAVAGGRCLAVRDGRSEVPEPREREDHVRR
mmetsp:Transcript_80847/g.212241  ORF Transcript_80847/g.212241 Transcript_80847/m.212241 type:complete len:219 (+) Transcript_80847:1833-2489(+)